MQCSYSWRKRRSGGGGGGGIAREVWMIKDGERKGVRDIGGIKESIPVDWLHWMVCIMERKSPLEGIKGGESV